MKLKTLSVIAALSGVLVARAADPHFGISLRIGVPAPVIVREAPPRPVVVEERRVAAPGPNYVWVAGHHSWDGNRWVWIQGAWVVPPQPGALWVEGRWDSSSRAWTEGHWEIAQTAAPAMPPPPPPAPGYAYDQGAGEEISVNEAPPPPREEVVVERPSRDHIWIAGYWGWNHGRHEWVSGHWELPPRGRHEWIAPRWERRGSGYVFFRGYWR